MQGDPMRSPPMVARALMITVVACLSNSCAAKFPELGEAGARHLIAAAKPALKADTKHKSVSELNTDCTNKFPKLDYTPVTSVCKPEVLATGTCCKAFNENACQFRSQVNNFDTVCPILFMAYLKHAGGYSDGYFIDRCTDGKNGLCV